MNTIHLTKQDIYRGHLILVNDRCPIQTDISQQQLLQICINTLLERDTAKMLLKIFHELDIRDQILYVSGYRSNDEQTLLYKESLQNNGENYTKKFVALPKCSEHETGLAIDLAFNQGYIDYICPNFPYDGICQKFRELCYDYGFVERYLEDKKEITHIAKEPWHFRYVGYPHSMIMKKEKLCLEEYHELIKQYSLYRPYRFVKNQRLIEIFYVPIEKEQTLCLKDDAVIEVSGNNMDGVIVTAWRTCL